MKPFAAHNNADSAKLLHELFPQHMAAFLDFAKGMAATVREDGRPGRKNWQNDLLTFDNWLSIAAQAETVIEANGESLHSDSGLFAAKLFGGQLATFTIYCLLNYTTVRQHPDRKFVKAVDLLFNP